MTTENVRSEREKLESKLSLLGFEDTWAIADFILADRRRIVEPALTWDKHMNTGEEIINKILENAGVTI